MLAGNLVHGINFHICQKKKKNSVEIILEESKFANIFWQLNDAKLP